MHYTNYSDVISIGVTGYKDSKGEVQLEIGVYYVSKDNFGLGQKVEDYTDLSFLKKENFDDFMQTVDDLHLTYDEIEELKTKREKEINASLVKVNNDIYKDEKGLGENDRVYLVAATIIATLGIPGKVSPLEKSDLKSSSEIGYRDGDIIVRKIESFLEEKHLPKDKKELIIRTLKNTILAENINKVINGETQLKRVFTKIVDDLGIYYKIGLNTDFTGKLFNEMYAWLGFSQDKLNDVVLTPSYVAKLLVKLARVNMNSYVWDFATGSAGLLIAAMNEMLLDAQNNIKSPDELERKKIQIKATQLLGLEILPSIYMLAILNMILMGDGSSNVLNKDSLKDFKGYYGFGNTDEKFPADAFILNPPYSAEGCGMVFVEKALSMMEKGYAAIIIQSSAGSGKAKEINKRILKNNTLIASIKMPNDLFVGKSSVQTYIYVFRVSEAHQNDEVVKFIDFTNDGYTRTNRRKASNNLKDTDYAKERYQEVVDLVRFGKGKLDYLTEDEYYEGHIDKDSGIDWNQSAPIDTKPTLEDFKKTVSDYLAWEVSNLLKNDTKEDERSKKINASLNEKLANVEWGEYRLGDLFEKVVLKSNIDEFDKNRDLSKIQNNEFNLPLVNAKHGDNGIMYYGRKEDWQYSDMCIDIVNDGAVSTGDVYAQPQETGVLYNAYLIKPKVDKKSRNHLLFYARCIEKTIKLKYGYENKASWEKIKNDIIQLPKKNNEIDYEFMESFIAELEAQRVAELEAYLSVNGLKDYKLTDKEKQVIDDYKNGRVNLIKLKISDIFNVSSSKKKFDANKLQILSKGYPYVVRTSNNNGIRGYLNEDINYLNDGNTISFGQDTATMFYQEKPYFTGDKIKILKSKFKEFNKYSAQYFISTMAKTFSAFAWGASSFSESVIKEQEIFVKLQDNKIDFEYIEILISAVQKLVIKDVVDYADNKIEKTKQVVNYK